jgi:hypothetical protein
MNESALKKYFDNDEEFIEFLKSEVTTGHVRILKSDRVTRVEYENVR